MSKPGTYNIAFVVGSTFTRTPTYKAGDPPTPVNLTGWTAKMQFRDSADALIAEMSTSNGGITLGGVAGTIALRLAPAATLLFAVGTQYSHDLRLTDANGDVTVLLRGAVRAIERTTR